LGGGCDRTLRILLGEVGQVLKGIRQSITKRGLFGPKAKTLSAVAYLQDPKVGFQASFRMEDIGGFPELLQPGRRWGKGFR
jgi:hypothetical protein